MMTLILHFLNSTESVRLPAFLTRHDVQEEAAKRGAICYEVRDIEEVLA